MVACVPVSNNRIFIYQDIVRISLKKQFVLSSFIQTSLAEIENLVAARVATIPKNATIGIFGNLDSASVIHRTLFSMGCRKIVFLLSDPQDNTHRGCPVWNVNEADLNALEVIFCSSLANGAVQNALLQDKKFEHQVLAFPALKHLSNHLSSSFSNVSAIKRLVSNHDPKPAFIIGNSPSLRQTDPMRIPAGAMSFAANGIVLLENFSPTHYFLLDRESIQVWSENIRALPCKRLYPEVMKPALQKANLLRKTDILFPNCYRQNGKLNIEKWESRGFESHHSVACIMLQFAYLMQCNPIFLIGIDVSYTADNGRHFSSDYHQVKIANRDVDFINSEISVGLERSVTACLESGREVYNCSPMKKLHFLKNMDFEEAIQRSKLLLSSSQHFPN